MQKPPCHFQLIQTFDDNGLCPIIKDAGRLITTANGDNAGLQESRNNTINIDGTLKAGKNNVLDILIENDKGNSAENSRVVTVNVAGADPIKVRMTVRKGNSVVDVNNIQAGSNVEIINPFIEEYNETKKALDDYPKDSQQYKDLQSYLNGIADSMVTYGFAEKTSNGYNIHEKITQTVVDIPDFELSGGVIEILTEKLGGNGSLTARSAIGATINNTSPLPLHINKVDMENAGGNVSLNGNVLKKNGYNFKTLDMDGNFDKPPILEITHSGKKYGSLKPDIYIDGDINDSTGKVTLKDEQGSVIVRGNILASGGIDIVTPNGGFMLNNTKETFNLTDSMAKYTFGNEAVASALQKYIALKGNTTNFASYDDYLNTIFVQITDAVKQATGGSTIRYTWKANIKKRYGEGNSSDEPGASVVTNGPINITAKYINVNGIIQSGFTNYTGKVDSSKLNKISNLSSNAQNAYDRFQTLLSGILTSTKSYDDVLFAQDKELFRKMNSASSYDEFLNLLKNNGIEDLNKYFDKLIGKYNFEYADSQRGFVEFTNPNKSIKLSSLLPEIKSLNAQIKIFSADTSTVNFKDSEVIGNEKYLVSSQKGKVWNSSRQMYDGVVDIYYNPTTKNLLTDNINVNGGYVRLKGTVVSTGGGKIIAAKGGADISINTLAVDNDLILGAINNNNRLGVVIIDDPSKSLQTFTGSATYTPDNYAFG